MTTPTTATTDHRATVSLLHVIRTEDATTMIEARHTSQK